MRHSERTYDAYPDGHSAERLADPDHSQILTVQDVELGYGPSEWLDGLEDEQDITWRATKAVEIAMMREMMK